MSPRFYLIPLAIVGAGAAWLVTRSSQGDSSSTGSISVEVPRVESEWCREQSPPRRGWYCVVREFTIQPTGHTVLDASPNGGIEVAGWSGSHVQVQAKVEGRARSDEAAHDLVSNVRITAGSAGSEVKAEGPKTGSGESWSVSYRASVPHNSDLTLKAMNGSISLQDVTGELHLSTLNGSVTLAHVGGSVAARTVNGGIKAQLAGSRWDGEGAELRTTNGAIDLSIPADYNAVLEAATTNGGVSVDFPVTVTGRIGRRLNTVLGEGGATISATTTNGTVKIRRN